MNEQRRIQVELEAPFAETHKKQGLTYITGEQVTSRLNDVLGWDGWSMRVLEHGYDEVVDELWALVELTAGGVTRQQFGSQKPNRYTKEHPQHPGEAIDLGFDLKGSVTDGLKKCASLIGVGLYLHEREGQPAAQQQQRQTPRRTNGSQKPKPTFMEYASGLGHAADEVLTAAKELYDSNDPNRLKGEQKQRLILALEERKKKAPAA